MDGAVETEVKPGQSTEVETKPVHTRRMALSKLVGAAALGGVAATLLPHEHAEASHNAADDLIHMGQDNQAANQTDADTTLRMRSTRRWFIIGDSTGTTLDLTNNATSGGQGIQANMTKGTGLHGRTTDATAGIGVVGTTESTGFAGPPDARVGVGGDATNGIGVVGRTVAGTGVWAQATGGGKAIHAEGGRVEVQNANAEYRLIGQEASGRTWRLFSDGTSFNFRDETGAQNVMIVATDAVQFTKRLLPVGDAVAGMDLGIVGARWNTVRAQTVASGDLLFENGVRVTEHGAGVAFVSAGGKKIAVIDSDGNLRIRGKVIEGLDEDGDQPTT